MAARLTVIISQSARGNNVASDLEESLIAQLLMSPGFDATLVGPLENLKADSTDCLCISGFNHNLALVTWLSLEQVASHFSRLGLERMVCSVDNPTQSINVVANRLATVRDPSDQPHRMATNNGKQSPLPKVFLVQLTAQSRIDEVSERLQVLLEDRKVTTVGIQLPTPKPNNLSRQVPQKNATPDPAASKTKPPTTSSDLPTAREVDEDDEELSPEQSQKLDQLIDELDALDL
ncbi:MAG: hypothetical protein KDB22_07690 [Planctomycetales bacterium]|nr:hypothetical protein [Planctomycetales bacterium]